MKGKILSSFWSIVFYIRNITLLGLTTTKKATHLTFQEIGGADDEAEGMPSTITLDCSSG